MKNCCVALCRVPVGQGFINFGLIIVCKKQLECSKPGWSGVELLWFLHRILKLTCTKRSGLM